MCHNILSALDKSQVQVGLKRDGQQDPADGQTASGSSDNNLYVLYLVVSWRRLNGDFIASISA